MANSGDVVSYRALDERSNQFARLLRGAGIRRGDHVAVLLPNHRIYSEVTWAALRSGLYITPINNHLLGDEAEYILRDCAAKALVTSGALGPVAQRLGDADSADLVVKLAVDGPIPGFDAYEEAIAAFPGDRLDDESMGAPMMYSSGTTGRPKGILKPLPESDLGAIDPQMQRYVDRYGFRSGMVYLSPAPTYHSAPFVYSYITQRFGGTVVTMERFDATAALQAIERERVTHSQWVPTMFSRMLRLDPDVRARFDLSSHEVAIHAAAPCPIAVKQEMIRWWGPILHEYYAASEGMGSVHITSAEWLAHPGSVGRADLGEIHVIGPSGNELPGGEVGTIYFAGGAEFEYLNDPEKTAASRLAGGLRTVGDVGYVDGDGWLYLTDRAVDMIISGGVNIYPREAEDVLLGHPGVGDVAVFGIPSEEYGEEVKAAVQLLPGYSPGPELERELIAYSRARLAAVKCPRTVDFVEEFPRLPTGKLYKRQLRDPYWKGHATGIV